MTGGTLGTGAGVGDGTAAHPTKNIADKMTNSKPRRERPVSAHRGIHIRVTGVRW